MASFKKFKIGNTSYDVKDANAGYSLSTSGSNLSLKNSAGTAISTVTVNGMDYDIIADEFDTTPTPTPGVGYDQNDVVYAVTQGQWGQQEVGWYVSLVNNNTSTPNHDVVGDWALLGNGMSPALSIPGWVNQYGFDYDPDDHSYYRVNLGAGAQINRWDELTKCPDKGTWTNQGGGSTYHQYSVGDYVIYNNDLYRCTGATTGQSWNSSKWTQVQIMDEIPSVPSNIVNSVSVTPIYTSGTPIAQISVTGSGGTDGWTITAPSVATPIVLQSSPIDPTTFVNNLLSANDAQDPYTVNFNSNKTKSQLTTVWKNINTDIWLDIGGGIAKIITRYRDSMDNLSFVAQYGWAMVLGTNPNYMAYKCSNIYGVLNFSGTALSSIDFYIDNNYYKAKYNP